MLDKIQNDDNLTIIGISGYATSGKDTFAKIAWNELFKRRNTVCKIFNFAEDLKNIVNVITIPHISIDCARVSKEVKPKIRCILVGVGEGFRNVDEYFWVKTVKSKIDAELRYQRENGFNFKTYVFTCDVRFNNEAEWIKSHKNGFIISISREGISAPNSQEMKNIPEIASKYADLSVLWPSIQDCEENLLVNKELIEIVNQTLRKIDATI